MPEKIPKPNTLQGKEIPPNPEQEKGAVVPVEELIPNIKSKNEVENTHYGSNHFDNNFMPEFSAFHSAIIGDSGNRSHHYI